MMKHQALVCTQLNMTTILYPRTVAHQVDDDELCGCIDTEACCRSSKKPFVIAELQKLLLLEDASSNNNDQHSNQEQETQDEKGCRERLRREDGFLPFCLPTSIEEQSAPPTKISTRVQQGQQSDALVADENHLANARWKSSIQVATGDRNHPQCFIENIDFVKWDTSRHWKIGKDGRWKSKTGNYHDEYSCFSYDDVFKGIPVLTYRWGINNAWRRHHRGSCDTCSYGAYSSVGYNYGCTDDQMMVLPQLESAVSLNLKYPPFVVHLQKKITHVYDQREELFQCVPFSFDDETILNDDQKHTIHMIEDCIDTVVAIKRLLKNYIDQERRANIELALLALGVYKCQLRQVLWAQQQQDDDATFDNNNDDGWNVLKAVVPHESCSAIGIIVKRVTPFLLG